MADKLYTFGGFTQGPALATTESFDLGAFQTLHVLRKD